MSCALLHLNSLLEKMTSLDKDFRFMATNDLMAELQRDSIKLDDEMERKVVTMLLKLLEDKNGEVQNLAVKCLGALVNKVDIAQLETVVDNLCSNMQSDKEPLRDISSIGLKTVISVMPLYNSQVAPNICKRITNQLMASASKQEDVSVQLDTLDILADLLDRFGTLLTSFHQNIQQVLLHQLHSPRLAVRKRAVVAISQLSSSCSDAIFHDLIAFFVNGLDKNASSTKTYIQCLGAITRESGHRLGEQLDQVINLVMSYCKVEKSSSTEEEDDELKECCMQTLESFIRRCPKYVSPHLDSIINICLKFLIHDPNYSYDALEDEDDVNMDSASIDDIEEGDDDDNESDDFTDDDDVSWKVRRAAAKCLAAIISTRHDLLNEFFKVVSPVLISRFKEREENVKADIFATYIILLRRTRSTVATKDNESLGNYDGSLKLLSDQVPSIVRSVNSLLKEKSLKTRQNCFSLLSEIALTLPSALSNHAHLVISGIKNALTDKNTSATMKIEALSFAHLLLDNQPPPIFQPHLSNICPCIILCISDPFYKIASEALLVSQQIVKLIRPTTSEYSSYQSECNFIYIENIFDASFKRLQATDVDQEVKERAITCTAQCVCNAADIIGNNRLKPYLPFLVDKLSSETTRQVAAKAIALIVSSKLGNPFPVELIHTMLQQLKTFLGSSVRELRLCGLHCLDCIMTNGCKLNSSLESPFSAIVKACTPLINDSDLYVAQMAMQLLMTFCNYNLTSIVLADNSTLNNLVELTKSPLLQGPALQAVVDLLVAIQKHTNDTSHLVAFLMKPVYESTEQSLNHNSSSILHKQAFSSLARCIASIVSQQYITKGAASVDDLLNGFITAINDPNTPPPVKQLIILSLGEIGCKVRLDKNQQELQESLINCFASNNNNIKQASAVAIGGIAVGNMDSMLPFILREIESTKRQYLLLHSLKEVITCQHSTKDKTLLSQQLTPYISQIWKILINSCECQEEGTRNVVAECLGKLALLDRTTLIPQLRSCLTQTSSHTRSTVITAIKFVVTDQPQPQDDLLKSSVGDFLSCLVDPDIKVRRVALVAFNSIAHNKPSLIKDLLKDILPQLYSETKVKPNLIREVEMGPFTHTIDDGLDIRKAAFECMYTLLDTCLDKLDVFEFLSHVEEGLNDHYDIKMLTYLMLTRLSFLCPGAVFHRLDRIIEPLKATCMSKVRSTSVKQEFEKQEELKRSALRAVLSLSAVPDADKCPSLVDFLNQIRQNQELAPILESIKESFSGSSSVPWVPSSHSTNKGAQSCLMDLS